MCVFVFLPGGGVPHLTRRGGSEVCVVISGQHQGQVYLCDTANLGSSAHRRHPVSEGCPGRFQHKLRNQVHVNLQRAYDVGGVTVLHREEDKIKIYF